jgi:hypothetical protein
LKKRFQNKKKFLSYQPSKSGGETAFPNGAAVTSPLPSVSSEYDNFFAAFRQRVTLINETEITVTFVVYLLL